MAQRAIGLLVILGVASGCGEVRRERPAGAAAVSADKGLISDVSPPSSPCPLMLGDPAPPLAIEDWIKGPPVHGFEPGSVYVVDLWSTSCGPCIQLMPHLSELQEKYSDACVRFIGVNIWDDPANVEPFLKSAAATHGVDLMRYAVAIEAKDERAAADKATTDVLVDKARRGKMNKSWLKAACQSGLPSTFVIDRSGRVAWIGYTYFLDKPLELIVSGQWDIEAQTEAHAAEIEARPRLAEFHRLMLGWEYERAYTLGRELVAGAFSHNAFELNKLANRIVDPDLLPRKQDLDLALAAARRANELTGGSDAEILQTLATVHGQRGELDEAVELLERAAEVSRGSLRVVAGHGELAAGTGDCRPQ